MKKIIAIIALVSCCAGAAYAAQAWGYPVAGGYTFGTTGHLLQIKPSANVAFAYDGGTAGVSYAVAAAHAQGSRAFAGSSIDTNIFYQDMSAPGINVVPTVTAPTAPATGVTTDFGAGWTASK